MVHSRSGVHEIVSSLYGIATSQSRSSSEPVWSQEALEEVKKSCLTAGAREVITLSYDLAEENNCELAVAETVRKFK